MKFFRQIQNDLESLYQIKTNLDVSEFICSTKNFKSLGALWVNQDNETDVSLRLMLDQDIFEAALAGHQDPNSLVHSVCFEEVSHFVYLSWNHLLGKNVTAIEMEMQSEIDRIYLAFHGSILLTKQIQDELLLSFLERPYPEERHEFSRLESRRFLRSLESKNPSEWTQNDFDKIRNYFHCGLNSKLALAKGSL
jgi:hypothetical protein